jgi:hypothetical protein
VFDSLEARKGACDVAQIRDLAFEKHDFKAVVMIHMDVRRRNDRGKVMMLDVGEFLLQFSLVVVVNDRKYAEGWCGFLLDFFFNKPSSYQVTEGF